MQAAQEEQMERREAERVRKKYRLLVRCQTMLIWLLSLQGSRLIIKNAVYRRSSGLEDCYHLLVKRLWKHTAELRQTKEKTTMSSKWLSNETYTEGSWMRNRWDDVDPCTTKKDVIDIMISDSQCLTTWPVTFAMRNQPLPEMLAYCWYIPT